MPTFSIDETKTHFSKLLSRAMNGEEIIITRAGKPIARLLSFEEKTIAPRVPGIDKGKVIIRDNFDDSLSGFESKTLKRCSLFSL